MQGLKTAFLASILSLAFLLVTHGFSGALEVGQPAPDFELESTKGGKLKLSSLKGKNVLINFYAFDYSPT
jgi:cytochrome oxidase Cu insertion factor (SCO1/SenC/PrrC family)